MDHSLIFAGWITHHEAVLRLIVFLGLFAALAASEIGWPRRDTVSRRSRWWPNLAMLAVDALVLRFAFPLLAVGVAAWAQSVDVGLFRWLALSTGMAFITGLLLLDLAIWAQHWLMHRLHWLWRLHRVHHTDREFDISTAVRFHPAEIALSMLYKMVVVAILGMPVVAVIVFEIALNATALFNHSNLHLPASVDRLLRLLVVTPDMHRVHHSVWQPETDSNYGFNLPWWDRLFGTYRDQPRDGHAGMRVGLETFRGGQDQYLRQLLIQPLRAVRHAGPSLEPAPEGQRTTRGHRG